MANDWSVAAHRPFVLSVRTVRDGDETRALFAPIAGVSAEVAGCAYLDPKWRILALRYFAATNTEAVNVPIDRIAHDAIVFGAVSVVLAHNHPGGDATPSDADTAYTRRLALALEMIGIRLVDHVILAGVRYTSFRDLGLL